MLLTEVSNKLQILYGLLPPSSLYNGSATLDGNTGQIQEYDPIPMPDTNTGSSHWQITWIIQYITCEDVLDQHVSTESHALDIGIAAVEVDRQDVIQIKTQHSPPCWGWCRTCVCWKENKNIIKPTLCNKPNQDFFSSKLVKNNIMHLKLIHQFSKILKTKTAITVLWLKSKTN